MKDQEFEDFINKIQGEVFDEAREALGEKGFERWRNPKYCGVMEDAHYSATLTGECGDTMQMYIQVEADRLGKISYFTDGCSSSSIAGSFAAELGMGKTFEEVLDLTGADVLHLIGTFPNKDEHCTHLAIRTLQEAVNNYMIDKIRQSK